MAVEVGGEDRIAGVDKGIGIDEYSHRVHEAPLSRQVQRFLPPNIKRHDGMSAAVLRLPRRT